MASTEKDQEEVGLESGLAWAESANSDDLKSESPAPAAASTEGADAPTESVAAEPEQESNSSADEATKNDSETPQTTDSKAEDDADADNVEAKDEAEASNTDTTPVATDDADAPATDAETPKDLLETADINEDSEDSDEEAPETQNFVVVADDEDEAEETATNSGKKNSQSDTVAVQSIPESLQPTENAKPVDKAKAPHTTVRIIDSPTVYSGAIDLPDGQRPEASDKVVCVAMNVLKELPAVITEQPPHPWTVVGASPLIRRAFVSCRIAGLYEIKICAAANLHEKIQTEARKAGVKVEFFNETAELNLPAAGRVLFVDPCSLHDPNSLKLIQKWRGHKIALAVTGEGDGLRAQIEGFTIRELGPDVLPFEAFSAGVASIPIEYLDIVDRFGFYRALEIFVQQGLVGASHFLCSQSREFRNVADLEELEEALVGSLALNTDGLIDRFINRPLSLSITRLLYETTWIKADLITMMSFLFGILAGPLVSLSSSVAFAPIFATVTLWISLILDRVDGEIARLRLEQSTRGRLLDRMNKLAVNCCILVGLASWFDYDLFVDIGAGLAGFGFTLGTIASLAQPLRLDARHAKSTGDHIDGLLHNRNYYYLLGPALLALALFSAASPDVAKMIAGGSLMVAGTIVSALSLTLFIGGTHRNMDPE